MNADAAPRLSRIARLTAAVLLGMAAYAQFGGISGEPLDLFRDQDGLLILLCAGLLLAAPVLAGWRALAWPAAGFRLTPRYPVVVLVAAALGLLLWAGTYLVLFDYALTRDEEMAVFDATILRTLRLTAAVPPEWRDFVPALEPLYRLTFPGYAQWSSAYLPVNAALRAAFAVVDPALTNPFLAASGGVLLFAIARRLFPAAASAQLVALLLYFTSAQMIVNAMTPFAMTGHMTLNLLWLYLFLRGGTAGHVGAGLVGFLATGLHQIIFHPLFALPFLEHLRRQSRYRPLAFYLVVYACGGLFWMAYHGLLGGWSGPVPSPGGGSALAAFLDERVLPLIVNRDPFTLPLMNFNLLRFVAWQNLALVPLLICAIPLARRAEGIAQPLYWGVLLTLAAMFILLPFQSIGWGYRYLHGLLGSFALLAAYGWLRVERQPVAHALLTAGTAATLAVSIPYLVWQTRQFIRPSAEADRYIEALDADFVVIEDEGVSLAHAQVRNDPFLRNRPLRFSATTLSQPNLQLLCSRGTVAVVPREQLAAFGLIPAKDLERPRTGPVSGCELREGAEAERVQDRG